MQAETKGEITEILKLSKPHFDGKKFVYTSPYAVEEEELLLWSLTSLQGYLLLCNPEDPQGDGR